MGGASRLLVLFATPFPRPSALRLVRHRAVPLAALSAVASTASSYSSHHFRPLHPRLRLGFSVVTAERFHTQLAGAREDHGEAVASAPTSHTGAMHSWPEWTKLVDNLVAGGYYDTQGSVVAGEEDDDSLLAGEDLTEEFVKAAQACLSFARYRPDLLRMLAKKDIEILVENGSPFLFKNGANSVRRLRSFLGADGTKVLESERAQTVDIMRYLLSYACNSTATRDESFLTTRDLTETAIRSLLSQLFRLSVTSPAARLTEMRQTVTKQHFSRPTGQNIEMKKGDWICPKCSFMNFARNMACLGCNEARPKKVLSGEWECPQCDFFNYSRNMSCLRCDCKRPGESPFGTAPSDAHLGYSRSSTVEQILKRSNLDKSEIERKLAANDEKAERWFSKISHLDDSADLSSAIDDEDFPEIMPMRKGMNRFVVSTRKTPLQRRLANAQNRSNLGNSGFSEGHELQPGGSNGMNSHKPSESSISQMLDRILGRSSTSSETSHPVVAGGDNSSTGSRFSSSDYRQGMVNQRTDPDSVPFVPLPADMFSKNSNPDKKQSPNTEDSASAKASQLGDPVFKESESSAESSRDSDSFDASKGWSKKVAELDNVRDMANARSDDDFPEIMPMRKGENRFVVSKKKDRSLTSLQYKRRIAMEQANSVNFVPFVPFPPDYFAKKDKQPEASPAEGSTLHEMARSETEKSEESITGVANSESGGNATQQPENWSANQSYHGTASTNPPSMDLTYRKMDAYNVGGSANSAQPPSTSWRNQSEIPSNDFSQKSTHTGPSVSASSQQTENYKSESEGWKPSFSGKSLEGSAVTEPDPLDMSEEAKAARWFRRAAQIKDISELSNIPDEDFPEIMPMRKGVNRFVVSKRKTPLERRLTSPQYRRSLPIVRSEPDEDVN
ncbi:hypothetical protein OPV22_034058 [Ensete ventricosum]|uniref:RanBP2-type domain-containing protein n=1 Tax=Ensete ventricosum TaxID=4639 RepID=A0AAV8PRG3_ENSVE|nr:hypothetical protein OPV22_034058 [Ensete ventricosum]